MQTETFPRGRRDALFRCHIVPQIPALLSAARAMTPQLADAEDLVQETLVRAYRGIHRFDGTHPAWLMTILRHTQITGLRGRHHDLLIDPDQSPGDRYPALSESALSKSVEHVALDIEFDAAVEHALRSLTRKQRAVVAPRGERR